MSYYHYADTDDQLVPIPGRAIKVAVPDIQQRTGYSCGAACLEAVAKYFGLAALEEEPYFVALTSMDPRVGAHPSELLDAAEKLGLSSSSYEGMTYSELRAELDNKHPVLLTLQAYGKGSEAADLDYRKVWTEGHWVVAIGYDPTGVFFEDPSLEAIRGYLSYRELDQRWHDTIQHQVEARRVGLALWLDHSPRRPFYESTAQRIP